MRVRVLAVIVVVIGLFAGMLGLKAHALSSGVAFGASALPTWQTNGEVYAVGASHGKVIAGGTFSQISPPNGGSGSAQTRNALAVFDAQTGNPDTCQYTVGYSGGSPAVRAIVTSPDGNTVYIGGNFSSINGISVLRVAALDVVSCTVKPLRVNSVSSFVYGMAIYDNTLYLAGGFTSVAGTERDRFAAVNATTGALLPFVANADAAGRAIAVSPDGTKVALGGDINQINGVFSHSIAIVDAVTGDNIRTYPEGFIPATSVTKAIISSTDGKFYVGNEGTGGGVFDGRFAVDWATGDQVWRDNCLGATQAMVQYQGTLYVASHAHDCSSNGAFGDGQRNFFLAEDSATAEIYGWYPNANDGIGEHIGPRAVVVATGRDGQPYLWYGGEFTQVNGSAQQGLTRFGSADQRGPAAANPVAQAMSDGSVQVRMRTVTDPDDDVLTYRVYRNNSATPIWQGRAKSTWWKRPQVTFVDSSVNPGVRYSYRVDVTDGGNTSPMSPSVSATALTATTDYTSTITHDGPQSLWSSSKVGSWVQDSGAATSNTNAQSALAQEGVGTSNDSPLTSDPTGSLSFDGTNDYLYNDNYAPAPNVYSIETWIKTTTTSGGLIVGYGGDGRPVTGSDAPRLSGNYDRHIYMTNDGRVIFGDWTGGAQIIQTSQSYNDGQWHQIVATQGSSGLALYVDGLRIGTNPTTNGQDYWGVWRVGGDNLNGWPSQPSSNYFAGLIDETSLWNKALSSRTVADHYVASGRSLSVNSVPSDSYGAAVFAEDPTLYWRLGESTGTTAADSSYFGQNPGVYGSNVTLGANGVIDGNAAIRTSGDQSGTVATQTASGTPSVFSAQVWFKTDTNSGGKIFGFENTPTGNGSNYDKMLYMLNDGRLTFGTYVGGTRTVTTSSRYNDGLWHQATATLGSSGTKLYVDGALAASSGVSQSEGSTGYWRLGGGNLSGWPDAPSNFYFNGTLDEFAVYGSELAANTIASQYSLGIADHTPPTAPTGLSATMSGSTAQLTWNPSSDNVGVVSYRVYRGTSADFTPGSNNFVGESAATSYSDDSLDVGTYYYKVLAIDFAGNLSDPSGAASAVIEDTAAPTAPNGVTAELSGTDGAKITWTASSDNVGVTNYEVHRGTTAGFTTNNDNKVADTTDLTYTDHGLDPGDYYYKIIATDAAGNSSNPSDPAHLTVPTASDTTDPTPPTGLAATATDSRIDLQWTAATDNVGVTGYRVFRGTNSGFTPNPDSKIADVTTTSYRDSGLDAGTYYYVVRAVDAAGNVSDPSNEASASINQTPTEPVTQTISPTADAATYSTQPTTNFGTNNQLASRGDVQQQSFLQFDLPNAPAGGVLTSATLHYRTSTDSTAGSSDVHSVDLVSGAWDENSVTWNNRPTNVGVNVGSITGATATNTGYTMSASVGALQDVLGTTVTFRLSTTAADNLRIWSREASSSYRPSLTLVFSQSTDNQAPTTPDGLQSTAADNSVNLSWNASSDNVGVTGYTVYRGTTAGFTADSSSRLANTTSRTYTDQGLDPGTYYYKVTARDAEGNVSDPSAATRATVEAQVMPVDVTVPVTADAGVLASQPTTNYGTNTQLWSNGTPGQQSFLSFAIPAAPAGTQLSGATLNIRTSTDSTAASGTAHSLDLVSGAWTESAVTWNNRPANVTHSNVGTISGATATNTSYTVDLDHGVLADAEGSTVTLRISSNGSDNLRLWSNEASSSTYRPQLTLHFTPSN